jgi:hypothetical protein
VGLGHCDAAWCAHGNEIAGIERHVAREMLDDVGDLVN